MSFASAISRLRGRGLRLTWPRRRDVGREKRRPGDTLEVICFVFEDAGGSHAHT